MTDLERTLGPQLHRLAEELAPDADPLDQVAGARTRHRRQRRTRAGVTALAVVIAAIVVGVPTTLDRLSADPGDVAGPRPTMTPTTGERSQTQAEADAQAALEDDAAARAAQAAAEEARAAAAGASREEAEQAAQLARTEVIVTALTDRDPPLELRAGTDRSCPDAGPIGAAPDPGPVTDLAGGCRWSGQSLTFGLRLAEGQTEDEMVAEVDREVAIDGCTVRAMPSTVDVTPLILCPPDADQAAGTTWTLRVPDSAGAGYWVLSAAEGSGAAVDAGGGGLLTLVDLAAARW
ncbi:hypothetical protein [uncultured Modestobacter sp.]|uniref:hypothetical protein n=1 Tax=uncultured Modestobacter sp. TaxID=380048 RepID=UPI002605920B|nr:hypothetical protein [uncultured Modestobacter sp.]